MINFAMGNHALARSAPAIGLRQGPGTQSTSKQRAFPEQAFDDFRQNPQFDHVSVFRGLLQYLKS